jgi:circadian clock protein KaiC
VTKRVKSTGKRARSAKKVRPSKSSAKGRRPEQIRKHLSAQLERKKEAHLRQFELPELLELAAKSAAGLEKAGAKVLDFGSATKAQLVSSLKTLALDDIRSFLRQKHKKPSGRMEEKHRRRLKQALRKEKAKVLPIAKAIPTKLPPRKKFEYAKTGVEGFDPLIGKGIPRGSRVILSGAAGSGKTLFALQTLYNAVKRGEKAYYLSLEESEERLIEYLRIFGMNPEKYIAEKRLVIKRLSPLDISRSVEMMLAKAKGELLIDADPILLPPGFKPDWVGFDSIAALAATLVREQDSYRIYMEQLFKYLEDIGVTSLLISETEELPNIGFTQAKIEDFLADGIFVLYHVRRGNVRQRAVEVLKLRGVDHEEKVVAMDILDGKGIIVYPDQEVFGEL